jgi:hypothetical protein
VLEDEEVNTEHENLWVCNIIRILLRTFKVAFEDIYFLSTLPLNTHPDYFNLEGRSNFKTADAASEW